MHKAMILVGFWLATTAANVALAQSAGPPPDPQKKEMPRTRIAAETRARALFSMLDRNKDGYITPDELPRPHPPEGADGKARTDRLFAMMDKDGNGQISKAEFEAFRAERMQAHRGPYGDHRHMAGGEMPHGPGAWRAHGRHDRMIAMMFRHADTNHDGRISLAEAVNAALKRFDRIDINHDGVLSDAERDAAHAQFAMRMHHDGEWGRHGDGRYGGDRGHWRDAPQPAPSGTPQGTETN